MSSVVPWIDFGRDRRLGGCAGRVLTNVFLTRSGHSFNLHCARASTFPPCRSLFLSALMLKRPATHGLPFSALVSGQPHPPPLDMPLDYKSGAFHPRNGVAVSLPGPQHSPSEPPSIHARMSSALLLALSIYVLCAYVSMGASHPSSRLATPSVNATAIFGTQSESWAQYTPYYPVDEYVPPPDGCEITQASVFPWPAVNILQRHGARYPTKSATKAIEKALAKIQPAVIANTSDPQLAFIANFTYSLGEDDLVPFGAQESYDAGVQAYERYAALVNNAADLPFVRASDSSRVVQSATNWTAGFSAASNGAATPTLSVIISETGNDTLDDASCPSLSSSSAPAAQTSAWIDIYTTNITAALNAGAPGADLKSTDTQALINLCPFESVANEELSEWCTLFDELGAFGGYEYWGDLDKYYNTG
ncbi:uncharacterized protein FIBRA_01939 [Fibroporia radiculosa]|uniref:3-phytase n=1 Tax=Fibroporia radiculosa TaxID=599839 RepID=J4H1J3_9APHY|nr:uncharacterized protein FIBRA_01939 [Fibroporia radiculosa]CCL99914.1 predicted protein [Fibroporia radiculosa]